MDPRMWPTAFPMPHQRPVALMRGFPRYNRLEWRDLAAEHAAADLAERLAAIRCGGVTQTFTEVLYQNRADFTAFANSSSEGSLLTNSVGDQPILPAPYFAQRERRGILIEAMGVLSTTSTPTLTFQVRLGTTQGASFLSGTSVGVSKAITTASGISNQMWRLRLQLTCNTPGLGTGLCTLSGAGTVWSGGGFGSAPFENVLEPTTPDTATWTSTIDAALTQYVNLSATWSAASSSNTITCKNLTVYGLN